jgi:UDP-N-acetylmuramate-alanine ligase
LKVAEHASDQPIEGDELAAMIGKTHASTTYIENDQKLVTFLKTETQPGDVVAFLGSHGFRGMIEETVAALR